MVYLWILCGAAFDFKAVFFVARLRGVFFRKAKVGVYRYLGLKLICYCGLPVLLFLILFGGLAVFVHLHLSVSYGGGLKGEVDFGESEIRSFDITRRIAFGGVILDRRGIQWGRS